MTEILDAFREIFLPPVAYCVICLRSERERRLVDTKSLATLMETINLPFKYNDELQRLCWVCARRAAAALRLLLAVELSGALHGLFAHMRRPGAYPRVAAMLAGREPKAGAARDAPSWARRLAAVRAASALRTTDVLVVASPQPPEYLLPHASPHEGAETVLLEDDEPELLQVKLEDDITIEETRVQPRPASPPVARRRPPAGPRGGAPAPPRARPALAPGLSTYSILVEEAGGGARAPPPAAPPSPCKLATDWEDKIPMDVISYMDATDPQAALYMPALAAPPARAPAAGAAQPSDVIDLC